MVTLTRQTCLAHAANAAHQDALEVLDSFLALRSEDPERLSTLVRLCNELVLGCLRQSSAPDSLNAAHGYLRWAVHKTATWHQPQHVALRAVTLNSVGIFFLRAGDPAVALRCFEACISARSADGVDGLDEDDVLAHSMLNSTTALSQLGRHDEAFERAHDVANQLSRAAQAHANAVGVGGAPPDPSLLSAAFHNLAAGLERRGLNPIRPYRAANVYARLRPASGARTPFGTAAPTAAVAAAQQGTLGWANGPIGLTGPVGAHTCMRCMHVQHAICATCACAYHTGDWWAWA